MSIRKRMVFPVALAVGALVMMVVASMASATHPRPKGASPLYASLVPSYNACGTPNRTHGPPLAFPSCNPPVQSSTSLTVGSPDAGGGAANSIGFVKLDVKVGAPGLPEDSDVLITSSISDVRCKGGNVACGNANAVNGADYTGELQGNAMIRISDHYNGPNLNEAATVIDIPFPVNGTCASTPTNAAIGGLCTTATTANTVVPGSIKDTQRGVVEIQQLQINDGGVDGLVATTPNTLFEVQGIFIP